MPHEQITVSYDQDGNISKLTMLRPSNFHAHLRSGNMMQAVAYDTMCWVKHLLVMPNTGPIDTVEKVRSYHENLQALADEKNLDVNLVMTVYLTDKLTPKVIDELMGLPFRVAVKYYPPHQGATTGSGLGIPLLKATETLKHMANVGMKLLGHFESVVDGYGREIPMSQRERHFMVEEFPGLRHRHPDLLINIEHGSTAEAVERVQEDPSGRTTIGFTPHHLLISIDELLKRSWSNHGRCMPIPKTPEDVLVCRAFATSGDFRAHLGDDTAPHPASAKENMPFESAACGCWLPHSLALYALAFKMERALDERFVRFAALNGPAAWDLPPPDPSEQVRLVYETEKDIPEPAPIPGTADVVVPLGWTREDDRLKIGHALAH